MFKVDSNIQQVKNNVNSTFKQLISADKILRIAALDAVVLISDRVQQHGLKTDESPIGKYTSDQYINKRNKKGLQTSYVDQTFTGDMLGDFIPEPESQTSYVVGFRGKNAQIAEYNEMRYGILYQLSDKEKQIIYDNVNNQINATINNANR